MKSSLLEQPRRLLSLDIESLDLGTRPVITQIALLAYDLDEDEMIKTEYVEYLPIQPQLDMKPARTVSASTIVWWMSQSDEARARFSENLGDDSFDLQWLAKSFCDTFAKLTGNFTIPYVLMAKGPQFDVCAVETLLLELDLAIPWNIVQSDYNRVVDLRSLLRHEKVDPKTVPKPEGFIEHVAYWDALWQISQYRACQPGSALILQQEMEESHPLVDVAPGLPDTGEQRRLPIKRPFAASTESRPGTMPA